MNSFRWRVWLAIGLLIPFAAQLVAQEQSSRGDRKEPSQWTAPRAADGHPSLEGVWENNSATPLERPTQLANKPRLSVAELADLERRAKKLFTPESDAVFGDGLYLALLAQSPSAGRAGGTGTYSQNWLPDRYFEHRTSLIDSEISR